MHGVGFRVGGGGWARKCCCQGSVRIFSGYHADGKCN